MFGPIVAKGSLRLNPKPESDGTNYATPKVFILVDLEEIKLGMNTLIILRFINVNN